MASCLACLVTLPPLKYQGNPRQWCSESCRVWVSRNPGKLRRARACSCCGDDLPLRAPSYRKFCSESCRYWFGHGGDPGSRVRSCDECGDEFSWSQRHARFCSRVCRDRDTHRRNGSVDKSQRRRAAFLRVESEKFRAVDVFARDGWTCQLCHEAIDPDASHPDPRSASLDHVIPVSRGGAHTRANTQASHLRCNLRKGTRAAGEQLRLVG